MMSHSTAYILLTLTMALWGSSLVVARAAHEIVPPLAFTFWRWVIAVLVLLPIVWRKLPGVMPTIRRSWRRLALLCGFMVVGTTFSVIAVNYTTAINASLINGSQPIVTALVAFLVLRERLSLRSGLGVLAAFIGILIMISQGRLQVLLDLAVSSGDLVMLIAVLGWAFYAVELHRQPEHPSGSVLLFFIACTGLITVLPFYIVETIFVREFVPSRNGVAAIVYLSVAATLLAVYLWNLVIRSVGAMQAALFLNLIPVFGAAFAMLFLGESLYAYHLGGAALVFSGIVMAVRDQLATSSDRI
ncbi:MAG: DMT family transporter [Gammaproteobacteria bacterium]